jgi:hypothetical protein
MDRNGFTLLHPNLEEHATDRRGHFGVDLVRRNLEQGFVLVDRFADALDPADDRTFGH